MANNLLALYDGLRSAHPEMRGFITFRSDMADEGKRRQVYDSLKRKNPGLPEFSVFSRDMGFGDGGDDSRPVTPYRPSVQPASDTKPVDFWNDYVAKPLKSFGASPKLEVVRNTSPKPAEKTDGFWDSYAGDWLERAGAGAAYYGGTAYSALDKLTRSDRSYSPAAVGMGDGSELSLTDDSTWLSRQADNAYGYAETLRKRAERNGGKGFEELIREGDYRGAAGDVFLQAAESLPSSFVAMLGGGAGVALAGTSAGVGKYDALDREPDTRDMPAYQKAVNATLTGVTGALSEYLGSVPVGKWLQQLYGKVGRESAERIVRENLSGWMQEPFRRNGLWFAPVAEGTEEIVSRIAENITDYCTGVSGEWAPLAGTLESFVYGAGGGLQFSAAGAPGMMKRWYDKRAGRGSRDVGFAPVVNKDGRVVTATDADGNTCYVVDEGGGVSVVSDEKGTKRSVPSGELKVVADEPLNDFISRIDKDRKQTDNLQNKPLEEVGTKEGGLEGRNGDAAQSENLQEKGNTHFRYFTGTIRDLFEVAKRAGNKLVKQALSPVTERQINDLRKGGVEIDNGFIHTIDNFAINHVFKKHGNESAENSRGQIAVTESDFARIPDVLEDYDKVDFDKNDRKQDLIRYSKSYGDGTTVYVEEVRVGRNELAMVTMYKRKRSTDDVLDVNIPTSHTPVATSDFPLSKNKDSKVAGEKQRKAFIYEDVKSVGRGVFGNIYDQFRGKAREAVDFLLQRQEGEAVGALHHPQVGDIDLVWGKPGTSHSDGFGLSKIAKYHPEVLNDLQGILNDMSIEKVSSNRINMESLTHKASVRLEWDGEKKTWLLTAFEKETPTSIARTTDIDENHHDLQNDTAPLQDVSVFSKSKDNEVTGEKQTYGTENISQIIDAEKNRGGLRDADEQKADVSGRMPDVDENGIPFVKNTGGNTIFGKIEAETGLQEAPIKLSEGFQSENGNGYGLMHIEAQHGSQIRNAGFDSVEQFIENVASNFTTIREGKDRSGNNTYLLELQDKRNNTLFVELSKDNSYWNVNSAGVFRGGYSKGKEIVWTLPALSHNSTTKNKEVARSITGNKGSTGSTSGNSPQTISLSTNKDSEVAGEKQAYGTENIIQIVDAEKNRESLRGAVKERRLEGRNGDVAQSENLQEKGNTHFRYFTGTIRDLFEVAKRTGNKLVKQALSPVTERQINDLRKGGVEIDDGFIHTIDNFAINHVFKKHGNESAENSRGQIAVTESDFARIPDVLEDYDKVDFDKNDRKQDLIRYSKSYGDGTTVYIEEVRTGKNELAMSTMYKMKKRLPNGLVLTDNSTLSLTPETPLSLSLSKNKDNEVAGEKQRKAFIYESVKPVGRGVFGNIYDQFRGKAREAVDFLLQRQEGEAVGALHHPQVGDIDLVWGNEKAGLMKIARKHPEVLDGLQEILNNMQVIQASDNRIVLNSATHRAVISKKLGSMDTDNWLLTAYEKKNDASASSSDIETEPIGKQNGTAPLQNIVFSKNKDSKKSGGKQENLFVSEPVKPVGRGFFGNIYDQFRGRVKEAFDFLLTHREGDLLGVFHRDDIGDIDLVWGEVTDPINHKGKGLAHIVDKHIKAQQDFSSVNEMVRVISDVISNGEITSNDKESIELVKAGKKVVVAKTNDKRWVLTAYDNLKSKREKKSNTTIITPGIIKEEGAVSSEVSSLSTNKDSEAAGEKQRKAFIYEDVKPVGRGVFGSIYDQFRGKAREAVDFLLQRQEGEAVGALHHPQVGDIDLVWGNEKAGLMKIARKHPEVLDGLQEKIETMNIVSFSDNRIILESKTDKAVVSRNAFDEETKQWLLTAYEKKNANVSGSSIDIEPEPKGKQNGTAPLQNINVSVNKDSEVAGEKQAYGTENVSQIVDAEKNRESLRGADEQKADVAERIPDVDENYQHLPVSKELDVKGNPFIISPNGTTIFGEINKEQAEAIGTGVDAPVKLSLGNETYGKVHIDKRIDQLKQNGYNSTEEFVARVLSDYDEIRSGNIYTTEDGGTKETFLVVKNATRGVLYIELTPDGKYYDVNSGGVFKDSYIKKRDLLWNASTEHSTISGESQDFPLAQQNPESDNVSALSQSNSLSTNKDSEVAGEKQAYGTENISQIIDAEKNREGLRDAVQNLSSAEFLQKNGKPDYNALLEHNPVLFAEEWEKRSTPEKTKEVLVRQSENVAKEIEALQRQLDKETDFNKIADIEDRITELEGKNSKIDDVIVARYAKPDISERRSVGNDNVTGELEGGYQSLTHDEIVNIMAKMQENAVDAPVVELSPENWVREFGDDGMVETPIGKVKMGENQYFKLLQNERGRQFGMVKPTLTNPDVIVEDKSSASNGEVERECSYVFIKTFNKNGQKYRFFTSVTVKKEGLEVSISSHLKNEKRIVELLRKGKLQYRVYGDPQTQHSQPNVSVTTSLTDNAGVSTNKDSKKSGGKQENLFVSESVKPVGRGFFGNIYDQFRGKVKEAFDFLLTHREGDLLGVFHRDDIGDIDLVWGKDEDKTGLDHIIEKHIKRQNDFASVDEAMAVINDVVNDGEVTEVNEDKVILTKGNYKIVVRKNIKNNQRNIIQNKNWIVTAFDYVRGQKEKTSSVITRSTPDNIVGSRAVTPEEIFSTNKDSKKSGGKQENPFVSESVKPVGRGFFGNIYDQFRGKVKEAFDFLLTHREGDLLGVFHRDDIGDIDLVWGKDEDKTGLDHIIEKHIKRQNDFASVDEAMAVINDVVNNGIPSRENIDKVVLDKDGYRVVIGKQLRDGNGNIIRTKNWVITGFDRSKSKKKKTLSEKTLTTPPSDPEADGVTLPSNSVSIINKDSEKSGGKQGVGAEDGSVVIKGDGGVRFREVESVEAVNTRFNDELEEYKSGKLGSEKIFNLGKPQSVLRSAGVQDKEITMNQSVLSLHLKKHGLAVTDMKNLPDAIQHPVMVYEWGSKARSLVVITDLSKGDHRVTVAIKLERNGQRLEVNEVASVHGKSVERLVADMNDERSDFGKEKLRYINKEKALDWLSSVSSPLEPSAITDQELSSATNIVKNFDNPSVLDGEISSVIDELSGELGVEVKRVKSRDELPDGIKRQMGDGRYAGVFDPGTGDVYVVTGEITDAADAQATVLHEVLGHKGMRGLFGERLPEFCSRVLTSMDEQKRAELVEKYNGDGQLAVEEYVASFAEGYTDPSAWGKVKAIVKEFIRELGVDLKLSDNDLKYLLWKARRVAGDNYGVNGRAMKPITKVIEDMAGDARVRDVLFRDPGVKESDTFVNEKMSAAEKSGGKQENLFVSESVKPVGRGFFGNIYDQFRGKVKEAFDFLLTHREGDLLGVFHRDDIGDIDLVWGEVTDPINHKGKGLAHIVDKHIKAQQDFSSVNEIADVITDVVNNGHVVKNKSDKVILTKDNYKVVISRATRATDGKIIQNKKWIITAFDYSRRKDEKTPSNSSHSTPTVNLSADGGSTLPSNEVLREISPDSSQ